MQWRIQKSIGLEYSKCEIWHYQVSSTNPICRLHYCPHGERKKISRMTCLHGKKKSWEDKEARKAIYGIWRVQRMIYSTASSILLSKRSMSDVTKALKLIKSDKWKMSTREQKSRFEDEESCESNDFVHGESTKSSVSPGFRCNTSLFNEIAPGEVFHFPYPFFIP